MSPGSSVLQQTRIRIKGKCCLKRTSRPRIGRNRVLIESSRNFLSVISPEGAVVHLAPGRVSQVTTISSQSQRTDRMKTSKRIPGHGDSQPGTPGIFLALVFGASVCLYLQAIREAHPFPIGRGRWCCTMKKALLSQSTECSLAAHRVTWSLLAGRSAGRLLACSFVRSPAHPLSYGEAFAPLRDESTNNLQSSLSQSSH